MFSTHPQINFIFSVTIILSSAKAFNLDQTQNLLFSKELALYHLIPRKLPFENIVGEGENASS